MIVIVDSGVGNLGSLANMLTGLASSLRSLGAARFLLGAGESGLYTVAPKVAGELFP